MSSPPSAEILNDCLFPDLTPNRDVSVAGTSFIAFHFMLDSLSHMNDKDKQQVCNDFSISLWEC